MASVELLPLKAIDFENATPTTTNGQIEGEGEGVGERNESDKESKPKKVKPNIRKDIWQIILLMYLYFLQGIPVGLANCIPLILASKKVNYAQLSIYSFALWPNSLKILWAPLVDSFYSKRFGRRKSWISPAMILIGVVMIAAGKLSYRMVYNLDDYDYGIYFLAFIFGFLCLMAAFQDVAVDGWGLNLISDENLSWTSTCDKIGVTLGTFVANELFLVLESKSFSNGIIRPLFGFEEHDHGIVTIELFMIFFGCIFIISTVLFMIFVKEHYKREEHHVDAEPEVNIRLKPVAEEQEVPQVEVDTKEKENKPKVEEEEKTMSIIATYKVVWKIIRLQPARWVLILFFTCKIGFGTEGIYVLKLVEKGVPRENLAILSFILTPFLSMIPIFAGRFTNGSSPLKLFISLYPIKIIMILTMASWTFFTPLFKDGDGKFPIYFYITCLLFDGTMGTINFSSYVSYGSFFARIADPTVGGTYLTLIKTFVNFGSSWIHTATLRLINLLSFKQCTYNYGGILVNSTVEANSTLSSNIYNGTFQNLYTEIQNNKCLDLLQSKECSNMGGTCKFTFDFYYTLVLVYSIIGTFWIIFFHKKLFSLEKLNKSEYKVVK